MNNKEAVCAFCLSSNFVLQAFEGGGEFNFLFLGGRGGCCADGGGGVCRAEGFVLKSMDGECCGCVSLSAVKSK